MYKVINWITLETISTHKELSKARTACRKQGHTGEDNPGLTGYPPIARVDDEEGDTIYNPKFSKK